ncbi:MAG: hypothetical protein QOD77_841 [Thermoplasmata archaeon]|jgi:hypothetical protein|nr:hypothetical protein [Thermoplasmata archaeon]
MDDLSPRERRAQRAKEAGTKHKGPSKAGAWKVPLVIFLVIGLGALAIVALKNLRPECPDHWHGTFRVYTPNEDGSPRMLDMNLPKDAGGRPYYDLGTGKMRLAIHMHQSGPEQGSEALGPAQLHYEGGTCVGLRTALDIADVGLSADGLVIAGQHATTGFAGEWENNGNQTLRFWLQDVDGEWAEHPMGDYLDYQVKDGEAVLFAFGNYTDAQVQAMQASVPPPMSRPAVTA